MENAAQPPGISGVPESPGTPAPSSSDMPRRDALAIMSTAGVGVVMLSAGGIGAGFLWPLKPSEPAAVYTCKVQELPYGKPFEVRSPRGETLYLIRTKGASEGEPDKIVAMGTTCTHLGCKVFYRPETRDFHCPCHQGYFDSDGVPVAGPPERPLPHYNVKIENGLLFILYENL
ncbi:MAG: ubiquinol-cytochrome c reductase iron-sulfur subunit [Planctomycetes bacterium]|nr:ubiquinol-cytochrome c reductase iron-sulfur subunit [Planctomycetota bacterium]